MAGLERCVAAGAVLMALMGCQRPAVTARASSATTTPIASPSSMRSDAKPTASLSAASQATEQPSPSSSVGPRSVTDEPSVYAKFALTSEDEYSCRVSLRLASGSELRLFVVPDCSVEVPSLSRLEAAPRVGNVELPFVAPNGDEFHVFQIASARGGNATAAVDYWVEVTSPRVRAVRSRPRWSCRDA